MKTPDEIKKGLETHKSKTADCSECPYENVVTQDGWELCFKNLESDALAYIQQLEADNAQQARCIENLTDKLNATNDALQRWISVEERLPELNTAVLAVMDDGIVFQELFAYDGWDLWEGCTGKITHWMPMPEPPECKENGGAEDGQDHPD